jgi:hypothetical protein
MSLLLTVYNTSTWKTLARVSGLPLINDIPNGLEGPALLLPVQSLSALPALLSQLVDEKKIWLAAEQAEYFLTNAIESGSTFGDAAQQWLEQTNALLTLQRQNRRQLQLFNLQQALAHPIAFCGCLSPMVPIANYPAHPASNNLALLAACQYVAQHPELQALNNRLQATALPLCDSAAPALDTEQVFQHNNAIAAQLIETTKDHDLALLQLKNLQEEFETYTQVDSTECAEAVKERDIILLQLQLLQEELESYSHSSAAQLTTAHSERDVVLAQLKSIQEQLDQSLAENNNLQLALQAEEQKNKHAVLAHDKQQAKEIAKLEAQLRKTTARATNAEYAGQLIQQELQKLKGSTLWKATGPVRVLGSLIKKTGKTQEKLLQDTALLLTSEYFDINWYLQSYPDVIAANMSPAEHYLLYGAAEGRLPGPLFDGNWYLQQYPDVANAKTNPLLHFIMFGQQEGRSSSPILLTNDTQTAEE